MKCRHTSSIGAYLLGSLEPRESREFERHHRTCQPCRDELVRLAPLPGLLQHISPEDNGSPPAQTPFPTPRRPPRLRLAAAVLALAGAAGLAGYATGHTTSASPSAAGVSWSHTVATTPGMRATADLTARQWGTQISLHLADPPPGKQCRLVAVDRAGHQQITGWWTTGYYPGADVATSTSLALTDLTRLEVLDTDNTLLAAITD